MGPATIRRKYQVRILRIMGRIRDLLIEEGFVVDKPLEMSCDEFQWSMVVYMGDPHELPRDDDIDITFTICESEHNDEEKFGVNFRIDLVEYGGRIVGGVCPYNYSDECWADRRNPAAIEQRFRIMEDTDIDGIPTLIAEAAPCSPA